MAREEDQTIRPAVRTIATVLERARARRAATGEAPDYPDDPTAQAVLDVLLDIGTGGPQERKEKEQP